VLLHKVETRLAVHQQSPAVNASQPELPEVEESEPSVVVYDLEANDGVELSGQLVWYGFSSDSGKGCYVENLVMSDPVLESLHLEFDLERETLSGTLKLSGVQNTTDGQDGDYNYASGTAQITFEDANLIGIGDDSLWMIEGGTGTARIAMQGEYQCTSLSTGLSAMDNGSDQEVVPVEYIGGELSDRLLLELDAYNPDQQRLSAYLDILIPNLDGP
jgi:hypothetical protein